jgi:CheY-like chemotaxis protein
VISVSDTGVGIARENHRRVFEEFSQVENPLQKAVKGTGLGLPLSQRLAGLLGGSIDLQSELGKGSVFSLAIPLRLGIPAASGAPTLPLQRTAQRVLIVDDSEVERYALRQFLSSGLYDVVEAQGGYEGLRLARQSQPDVIFLDLAMPDIHGLEVLKMLKAIDETRAIPVILFTSQRPEDIDERQAAAASALLLKSELSRESVAAVIRRVGITGDMQHATHA